MASIIMADREWDLVGPDVDADVGRLISRYDQAAVLEAIKRCTKKRPGRKPDNDQMALRPIFDQDAAIWLKGADPFSVRSNYAIAKEYCEKIGGNSAASNFDRLRRKLRKNRRRWVLERAFSLSHQGYPYHENLRAIEALIECSGNPVWEAFFECRLAWIADYHGKIGRAPPAKMDMSGVEDVARSSIRGIGLLRHYDLGSVVPNL